MLYSAVVKDKETKKLVLVKNKDYPNKKSFIHDLKANGYIVNPIKVKPSVKFEYIMKYTDCSISDWKKF